MPEDKQIRILLIEDDSEEEQKLRRHMSEVMPEGTTLCVDRAQSVERALIKLLIAPEDSYAAVVVKCTDCRFCAAISALERSGLRLIANDPAGDDHETLTKIAEVARNQLSA